MAHDSSDPVTVGTNGDRLAHLRRRKRPKMTQQQLADAVGYSLASIKKFEGGTRSLDRGQQILKFAEALGCHPTEITGRPFLLPESDFEAQIAAGAVAGVRRALLMHDRPLRLTDQDVAAIDLDALARRVSQARVYRRAVALARSGEVIPELLRDLQIAAAASVGEQRRRAYRLLAYGYTCAVSFTYGVGHVAVTTLAAERALMAARETGDPLLIAAAKWKWADEFIQLGEHDAAGDIIDDTLHSISRAPDDQPEVVSLRGAFHLKSALNSARAADLGGMETALLHAQRAADLLGEDRDDFGLSFGPANVAIWSVSMPIEFGRGREAVRRGERIKLPPDYSTQRRSSLHIDLGRAYYLNAQREQALDAFLTAESIAPQYTRLHPAVRETVGAMYRAAPRGRLADLCLRVGID